MPTHEELLKSARKKLLSLLKDPQMKVDEFIKELDQAMKDLPDLMQELQPDMGDSVMQPDSVRWSAHYFSRHCLLAEHNFARERIEHLMKVRAHFSQLGVKGFVPSASLRSNPPKKEQGDMALDFIPSNNLQRVVALGDLLTIRIALHMELNDNRLTSADLRAALAWTKAKVSGLFDSYTESSFAEGMDTADRQNWNSEYYDTQGVYLRTNFSEERLLHLIEVRDLLREQKVDGFVALPPKSRTTVTIPTQENVQSKQSQSDSGREGGFLQDIAEFIGEVLESTGEFIAGVGRSIRPSSHDKQR